jgi:hypothetical protein
MSKESPTAFFFAKKNGNSLFFNEVESIERNTEPEFKVFESTTLGS